MDIDNTCGMLISQIHNSLEKMSNKDLKEKGLTLVQVSALFSINDTAEKKVTFKELEKILHLAQSTTVGIISRLEQKNLVTSYIDDNDKRIKYVRITELGEQCCKEAEDSMLKTETFLLSNLTEIEKVLFKDLLEKVNNTLK